jgi:alkylation response protein AidB-like acyl-CoA dehydrogenase
MLNNAQSGAALSEDDAMIFESVEKWLDRDVRPHVLKFEHADEYPAEMVEQMKALGLLGATIPAEYGGLGLSPPHMCASLKKSPRSGCPSPAS